MAPYRDIYDLLVCKRGHAKLHAKDADGHYIPDACCDIVVRRNTPREYLHLAEPMKQIQSLEFDESCVTAAHFAARYPVRELLFNPNIRLEFILRWLSAHGGVAWEMVDHQIETFMNYRNSLLPPRPPYQRLSDYLRLLRLFSYRPPPIVFPAGV